MDTFEIVENFTVHASQFFIQPDRTVLIALFALFCIGTVAAILASVYFFLSAVLVVFDRSPVRKDHFLVVGAS